MAEDLATLFAFNAAAQSPTTTPAKMTGLTNNGQYADTADYSLVPDAANGRILAEAPQGTAPPGTMTTPAQAMYYEVDFTASVQCAVAAVFKFTGRKGGVISGGATPDLQGQVQFPGGAADVRNVSFRGTIRVLGTDTGVVLATQPSPPAAGVGPGQAGALYQIPIEVYAESNVGGGAAMTILNACLRVRRVTLD